MTRKQSCRIFEKYAHQIDEMSTDELQKRCKIISMRKEKKCERNA